MQRRCSFHWIVTVQNESVLQRRTQDFPLGDVQQTNNERLSQGKNA